jgi:hypothetical protein
MLNNHSTGSILKSSFILNLNYINLSFGFLHSFFQLIYDIFENCFSFFMFFLLNKKKKTSKFNYSFSSAIISSSGIFKYLSLL